MSEVQGTKQVEENSRILCQDGIPEAAVKGFGKCRAGADQSQGHGLITVVLAGEQVPWDGREVAIRMRP